MSDFKRNTIQRKIVLNALVKLNNHPTIDEIYTDIRREHPSISKTTVYRNLRQLAKAGYVRQIAVQDGLERYDARTCRHYHFKCRDCNRIYDVDIGYLSEINGAVQEIYGFKVTGHDIIFSGVCAGCENKVDVSS
jgi:Fe2+ or Zn2+ uptake regulation protein